MSNMEDSDALAVAVNAYRKLREPQLSGRSVEGLVDADIAEQTKTDLERVGLFTRLDPETLKIEFSVPSKNNAFFAKNLHDLIESPDRQLNVPECFYIAEHDFYRKDSKLEIPARFYKLSCYIDISRLANILIGLSDYHEKKGNIKAVFLHGEKLELNLKFGPEDLKELANLKDFIETFVDSTLHKAQKTIIIKSVLIEMLKSSEIERLTLPCLIGRFAEFYERIRANYTLYVSEFSFEKIKAQVEKEVFEFAVKLDKAFSDIQNQLLAIPAALILAGTQMEHGDEKAWKNISIYVGLIIFSLFVSLLIRNQTNTLKAIKRECDSQWQSIKSKHKNVGPLLETHYSALNLRYISQRIKLHIVDVILATSMLATLWLLFFYLGKANEITTALMIGVKFGAVYIILEPLISWLLKAALTKKVHASGKIKK